jgi:hypothetical protein
MASAARVNTPYFERGVLNVLAAEVDRISQHTQAFAVRVEAHGSFGYYEADVE